MSSSHRAGVRVVLQFICIRRHMLTVTCACTLTSPLPPHVAWPTTESAHSVSPSVVSGIAAPAPTLKLPVIKPTRYHVGDKGKAILSTVHNTALAAVAPNPQHDYSLGAMADPEVFEAVRHKPLSAGAVGYHQPTKVRTTSTSARVLTQHDRAAQGRARSRAIIQDAIKAADSGTTPVSPHVRPIMSTVPRHFPLTMGPLPAFGAPVSPEPGGAYAAAAAARREAAAAAAAQQVVGEGGGDDVGSEEDEGDDLLPSMVVDDDDDMTGRLLSLPAVMCRAANGDIFMVGLE